MIERSIAQYLIELSSMYPVVTVTGPRQSGKTTLTKMVFPDYSYVSLENIDIRQFAETDPRGFLSSYSSPVIIDEIQRVPSLLSYIQTKVDENQDSGQYILTGSHQPLLGESVAQSLAGRTGLLQLLPFSINELKVAGIELSREEYLYKGFMPRLYNTKLNAQNLYKDYFATYIEKDIRQMLNIKNLSSFELFVKLLAGRVGQVVNLSSLTDEVAVSSTTLKQWLSVLEASFIVFQLPCYYENFGKRLIKNKKIYFTEPGLVAWLLGIKSPEQVMRDPLFGSIYENMVVVEALKTRLNQGQIPDLYFLRDSQGTEVDLIYRKSHDELIPIEIKSSMTWNKDFAKNIKKVQKLSDKFKCGYVVYSGDLTPTVENVSFINYKNLAGIFVINFANR